MALLLMLVMRVRMRTYFIIILFYFGIVTETFFGITAFILVPCCRTLNRVHTSIFPDHYAITVHFRVAHITPPLVAHLLTKSPMSKNMEYL